MLDTKYGSVKCVLTDGQHVCISGQLNYREIPISCNFHLHLIENEWKLKNYADLYLSRQDDWRKKISAVCHKAILLELTSCWVSWVSANPTVLELAERASKNEKYQRLTEELEELDAKRRIVSEQRAELASFAGCEFDLEEYMGKQNGAIVG